MTEQGKEDAAQTLSNLAFAAPAPNQPTPQQLAYHTVAGLPGINDPGPSSHPRGPPNLGQLSAVALQAAPAPLVPGQLSPHPPPPTQQPQHHPIPQDDEGGTEDEAVGVAGPKDGPQAGTSAAGSTSTASAASAGGRRGARSAAMGSDEWARQRKDNHVGEIMNVNLCFLMNCP